MKKGLICDTVKAIKLRRNVLRKFAIKTKNFATLSQMLLHKKRVPYAFRYRDVFYQALNLNKIKKKATIRFEHNSFVAY